MSLCFELDGESHELWNEKTSFGSFQLLVESLGFSSWLTPSMCKCCSVVFVADSIAVREYANTCLTMCSRVDDTIETPEHRFLLGDPWGDNVYQLVSVWPDCFLLTKDGQLEKKFAPFY
jgi:hypothetical protein